MGSPVAPTGPEQFTFAPDLSFLPEGFEPWFKDDFSFALLFDNVPVSGSQTKQATVDASQYFVCTQLNAIVSDQATGLVVKATTDAPVMVEYSSSSSRTQFQNQAVRIGTLCGTGEQPGYWERRGNVFGPGTNIVIKLTNLDPGNAWRVDFTLKGFMVYKLPDKLEF